MSVNHEQFFIAYKEKGGDSYEGENFIKIHYKTMKGENLWKKKKNAGSKQGDFISESFK